MVHLSPHGISVMATPSMSVNKLVKGLMGGGGGGASGASGSVVAGAAGAVSPILLAVGAVAALAVAAGLLAKAAQSAGMQIAAIYYGSGGSFAQAGRLAGLGALVGMNGEDVARAATQFNGQLISNPYARMAAQRAGITPNFIGAFGDINDTKRLTDFVTKVILKAPTDDIARREAYGTSAEKFLYLRQVNPSVRAAAMDAMATSATPGAVKDAANATALWNTAMLQFKVLATNLGNEVLPLVNLVLKGLVWLSNELLFVWRAIFGGNGDSASNIANASDAHQKALDRNTNAINNNTRTLNNSRQTFGGGGYAGHALPSHYAGLPNNGPSYQNQVQHGQIRTGLIPI